MKLIWMLLIFDINGKLILKTDNLENDILDISTLQSGTYYLKGQTDLGTFVKKIIKVDR